MVGRLGKSTKLDRRMLLLPNREGRVAVDTRFCAPQSGSNITSSYHHAHGMHNEITVFQANRKENEHEKALGEGVDDPGWSL